MKTPRVPMMAQHLPQQRLYLIKAIPAIPVGLPLEVGFVEGCTQLRNQRLAVSRMAAGLRLVVYESASTARQGASGAWAGSSA